MNSATGIEMPVQRAGDHQHARQRLRERIDVGVGHPAPRQQVVVEEHGREALDVLQLQQRQHRHAEGDEPLAARVRVNGVP